MAAFMLGAAAGICYLVGFPIDASMNVVFPGASLLSMCLGFHLLFAGIFAELIVRTQSKPSVVPLTTKLKTDAA